jgi:hypothetical protein
LRAVSLWFFRGKRRETGSGSGVRV